MYIPCHQTENQNNFRQRTLESDWTSTSELGPMLKIYFIYKVSSWKKIQKGYIKLNYVVCLSDTGSSCHGVTERTCKQKSWLKCACFLYKIVQGWSPVYVPEIETGRHVKNNVCTVEIKIKWMIRKHILWRYMYISTSLISGHWFNFWTSSYYTTEHATGG